MANDIGVVNAISASDPITCIFIGGDWQITALENKPDVISQERLQSFQLSSKVAAFLMARKKSAKKQFPARRKFNLRRDATVSTGQREIERVFGLPEGSVRLHLPSGRPARADKSIDALLDGYARR